MIQVGDRPKIDLRNLTKAEKAIRKAARIAISRAAAPVKANVVRAAQSIAEFGILAKSIRIRIKLYDSNNYLLMVGPSTKFKQGVARGKKGRYQKGRRAGEKIIRYPAFYASIISSPKAGKRYRPWLVDAKKASQARFVRDAVRMIAYELGKAMK